MKIEEGIPDFKREILGDNQRSSTNTGIALFNSVRPRWSCK